MQTRVWFRRPVIAWAAYDWANSAFTLSIVTVFLPLLLADYWNDGAASTVTTFRLGAANSTASLLVALISPLLGACADQLGRRKGLLLAFAVLGIVMTGSLFLVAEGMWPVALLCYVMATIGFAGGNSLYDSLLPGLVERQEFDHVSAYGFAAGYIGGALLLVVNIAMVSNPSFFGLESQTDAIRVAFLTVAVWWAVFSLPLFLWVEEHHDEFQARQSSIAAGLRQVWITAKQIGAQKNILLFLLAYWLYIDGVFTIIKMAVDYGLAIGLDRQDLIIAILITNFIGFPAALLFGFLGGRIGAQRGLYIAVGVYILVTVGAVFITTETGFYGLAVSIGLVQGGVQSLSRSMYAAMIPQNEASAYFGFYNMLGKFAAILGPLLMGVVALVFSSQRIAILSILVLFLAGLALLSRVQAPARQVL